MSGLQSFGTDLDSAYGPLTPSPAHSQYAMQEPLEIKTESKKKYADPDEYREKIYEKEPSDDTEKQAEEKLIRILHEIKKQKGKETVHKEDSPSYIDKLFAKKKDVLKLVQLSLIVVLGLCLHSLIEFYLKEYISSNDFTWERLLMLRLLYPLSIIFILWNLKTYVK